MTSFSHSLVINCDLSGGCNCRVRRAPRGFCLLLGETDHQKFQSSDDETCRTVYFKLFDYLLVLTFAYIFSSSSVSKSYKNTVFPLKTSICTLRPVECSGSTESSSGPLNSVNNFRIPHVVGN